MACYESHWWSLKWCAMSGKMDCMSSSKLVTTLPISHHSNVALIRNVGYLAISKEEMFGKGLSSPTTIRAAMLVHSTGI